MTDVIAKGADKTGVAAAVNTAHARRAAHNTEAAAPVEALQNQSALQSPLLQRSNPSWRVDQRFIPGGNGRDSAVVGVKLVGGHTPLGNVDAPAWHHVVPG